MTENSGSTAGPADDDERTHHSPYAEGLPEHGKLPEQIDGYRILDRIGEGGMGEVFLAEQTEPVRRRVALKVIRHGASTKQVLTRFEQERQALAVMDHEHIAKVFGAGATEQGHPYFVMELVEGEPLDAYCDKRQLSIPERLELFQKVCDGVQHAHAKGVMHRDLKPSNVLVVEREGKHTPKIIDFGLARATERQLIDQTLVTEEGQFLGTPEYMSPEQARGDALQIDTRTDVYSLGVLLYELLCGQLPFPAAQLRREGLLHIQAIIANEEPKKPSTRVTTIDEATRSDIARSRGLELRALSRSLTGDLDWIVMRAMAKEPERRYATPAGLAEDLRRFLEHEPVEAGPPTFSYRFRKFVRKNRVQVTAAAAVFVALAGGIAASLEFAGRAVSAEELATKRADDLQVRTDQYDQLSGVVIYERALARSKQLVPAWPETVPLIDRWIDGDVAKLRALWPEIQTTLEQLREKALPATDEQRRRPRLTHPRWGEFERLTAELKELKAATAVYRGEPWERPEIPEQLRALSLPELDGFAWACSDPEDPERTLGRARLALAASELSIERARTESPQLVPQFLDTLAWAQMRAGLIDEALKTNARCVEMATGDGKMVAQVTGVRLRAERDAFPFAIATKRRELALVESELPPVLSVDFSPGSAGEPLRFLYSTLEKLDRDLRVFFEDVVPSIEARREWASRIGELTRNHPNAGASWSDVSSSLAETNSERVHEAYREWFTGDDAIAVTPQEGLVPIGINPVTKLWEFYLLRSAWDGRTDPAEINIPRFESDGTIAVTEDLGVVLVLLPGGTFRMGAQNVAPNGPNYDRQVDSLDESPPHEIRLRPFLLARHELTKRQWRRLADGEQPSGLIVGLVRRGDFYTVDDRFPVEDVSWDQYDRVFGEHGLSLATEAQWEFGCRAGTNTPYATGVTATSLEGYANVLDTTAKRVRAFGSSGSGPFEDGYVSSAPVGHYAPNAFGLFDMPGSMKEWCLDEFGSYEGRVRPGDGLRVLGDGSKMRVLRGGSFAEPESHARSAFRDRNSPAFHNMNIGARVARAWLE